MLNTAQNLMMPIWLSAAHFKGPRFAGHKQRGTPPRLHAITDRAERKAAAREFARTNAERIAKEGVPTQHLSSRQRRALVGSTVMVTGSRRTGKSAFVKALRDAMAQPHAKAA